MTTTYDKAKLINQILDIYDPKVINNKKYLALANLIDNHITKLAIKKSKLEALVSSLQDAELVISYYVTTNITDEGHEGNGTLYIDLDISINDSIQFVNWLKTVVKPSNPLKSQNDLESFLSQYLKNHKVSFTAIGLTVDDYNVN